ncbi:uncharacterized protein LOC129321911 isoform X3 [Prosopis cineraria]|uniref:uncharacterized protein LOC129321911 isoform X3 n=1 Tax=Prosopis cineraria TaxID=364024 RepID=UPI002410A35A|nr:uncharacterized protein LOC129321911 isoform X3 [Prosopis cineraria]
MIRIIPNSIPKIHTWKEQTSQMSRIRNLASFQRKGHLCTVKRFPRRNSSLDLYERSVGEASSSDSKENRRVGIKHGLEGLESDSASYHSDHYDGNLAANPKDSLLHGYDIANSKNVLSEYVKFKPSSSIRNPFVSMDTKGRGGLSSRMIKEEKSSEKRKARKQCGNANGIGMLSHEVCGAKRLVDLHQQCCVKEELVAEMQPHKSHRIRIIPSHARAHPLK